MSQTERDLWPGEVRYESVVPPAVILREQGALLREKTKGLVVGQVESTDQPGEDVEDYVRDALGGGKPLVRTHTLYLVAPAMEGYRYSLLSVTHDFEPYPCEVRFHPSPGEHSLKSIGERFYTSMTVQGEDDFLLWLKGVFARAETKRVIYALISRVEETAQQ